MQQDKAPLVFTCIKSNSSSLTCSKSQIIGGIGRHPTSLQYIEHDGSSLEVLRCHEFGKT